MLSLISSLNASGKKTGPSRKKIIKLETMDTMEEMKNIKVGDESYVVITDGRGEIFQSYITTYLIRPFRV